MVKSEHNKSNFIYVKTFSSDLEGKFTRKRDFTWRMLTVKNWWELLTGDDGGVVKV